MNVFGSHIRKVVNTGDILIIKLNKKVNFKKFNEGNDFLTSALLLESTSPSTATLSAVGGKTGAFEASEVELLEDIEIDTWWKEVNDFLTKLDK